MKHKKIKGSVFTLSFIHIFVPFVFLLFVAFLLFLPHWFRYSAQSITTLFPTPTPHYPVILYQKSYTGKTTIPIHSDYSFTIDLPEGYTLTKVFELAWENTYDYTATITGPQKNISVQIRFLYSAGETSPTGETTIDGVPFVLNVRGKTGITCGTLGAYPDNQKTDAYTIDAHAPLTFDVSGLCKADDGTLMYKDAILEKTKMPAIIESIRFNPKLKSILLGETESKQINWATFQPN